MKPFIMTKDINGLNGFGLPFADSKVSTTLAEGVVQTLTVPQTGKALYPHVLAVFSFDKGSDIWVGSNETAALPGSSFAAATCELNPSARLVNIGDVLSFITADTSAEVGVTFYAIT